MKHRYALAPALALALALSTSAPAADAGVHAFTIALNDGSPKKLSDYRGKAPLMVNTASRCGYTKQYAPLEKLYEKYRDRGFEVLAFPANDFLGQEPGTNEEIRAFCTKEFGVTFPLFAKVSVKGKEIHPLYRYLTTLPGFEGDVTWNFNKFLVAPDGKVVARFGTRVDPMSDEVVKKLEELLPKKG